jgi:hypothetical protein
MLRRNQISAVGCKAAVHRAVDILGHITKRTFTQADDQSLGECRRSLLSAVARLISSSTARFLSESEVKGGHVYIAPDS